MTEPKEFDRDKAAKAIFGSAATTTHFDGPYEEAIFNVPLDNISKENMSNRAYKTVWYLNKIEDVKTIGDLVKFTEAEIARLPSTGKKAIDGIKDWLASEGLTLGMEPTLAEAKQSEAPADTAPSPAIETHDEFSTIADQMLPPGAVGYVRDAKKAENIVKAAKEVFAASEGKHRDGEGIATDYGFAIKRLPSQRTDKGITYPIYLSDAALEVLSQPEALQEFHEKKTQLMKQGVAENLR